MNIRELFGADDDDGVSVEKLTLYLPDKNRERKRYPQFDMWVQTAATLLAYVNRGSTTTTPASGKWWEHHELTNESTALVYSFIHQDRFERDAESIAKFVHTFGSRTDQSAVMVEMSGEVVVADEEKEAVRYRSRSYLISSYPKALGRDIPLESLLDHLLPDPLP